MTLLRFGFSLLFAVEGKLDNNLDYTEAAEEKMVSTLFKNLISFSLDDALESW